MQANTEYNLSIDEYSITSHNVYGGGGTLLLQTKYNRVSMQPQKAKQCKSRLPPGRELPTARDREPLRWLLPIRAVDNALGIAQ